MKLLLLGPPGAGKGTQAEKLSRTLGIPTISTGNILRTAIKNGTSTGRLAKAYMDNGQLVPDAVIIEIVKERLNELDCKNGFILDGMPRTIPQAVALETAGVHFDAVIAIDVVGEEILHRMNGRWICEVCGSSYHIVAIPPKQAGVCDRCMGKLVQREDDTQETVFARLRVYYQQTVPLMDFYSERKLLKKIDATNLNVNEVFFEILTLLGVQE